MEEFMRGIGLIRCNQWAPTNQNAPDEMPDVSGPMREIEEFLPQKEIWVVPLKKRLMKKIPLLLMRILSRFLSRYPAQAHLNKVCQELTIPREGRD